MQRRRPARQGIGKGHHGAGLSPWRSDCGRYSFGRFGRPSNNLGIVLDHGRDGGLRAASAAVAEPDEICSRSIGCASVDTPRSPWHQRVARSAIETSRQSPRFGIRVPRRHSVPCRNATGRGQPQPVVIKSSDQGWSGTSGGAPSTSSQIRTRCVGSRIKARLTTIPSAAIAIG
jgi:hypothetical protein